MNIKKFTVIKATGSAWENIYSLQLEITCEQFWEINEIQRRICDVLSKELISPLKRVKDE